MNLLTDKVKDMLIGGLTSVLVLLALYSYNTTVSLDEMTVEYNKIKTTLDLVAETTERDVEIIEKEVIKIQKIYVPKKEYIVKFVKDVNETDCNASNRLLSDFEY